MSKEIISEGNDFVVEQVSRLFKGTRTEIFKIDGRTGELTVNGIPLTGSSAIVGKLSMTGTGAGLLLTAVTAPSTPSSGIGSVYVDSTSKNIAVKDDAGVVKHGVQTKTAATNKVLTAISDAGVVTQAALPSGAFLSFYVAGNNGAGNVAAVGVKVGDKVIMRANTTDGTVATQFETTITVVDQIQQSGTDLSAKKILFLVLAQS